MGTTRIGSFPSRERTVYKLVVDVSDEGSVVFGYRRGSRVDDRAVRGAIRSVGAPAHVGTVMQGRHAAGVETTADSLTPVRLFAGEGA